MHLTELFETWGKKPLLIAIATNGLDSRKDRLLGVAYNKLNEGNTEMLLHETHGDLLFQAQKYHCINEKLMENFGLPTTDFIDTLSKLLEDHIPLSYNAPFQYSFISTALNRSDVVVYDITVMEQAIRKGLAFSEEELVVPGAFYGACCGHYYPVVVNQIFRKLGISRQPPPGELPAVWAVDALKQVYNGVSSTELQLLPS